VRGGESADTAEAVRRILERHPGVRAIYRYWGIEGATRRPKVELLWGSAPGTITYKEYGVKFELDPETLMFCLGNKFERIRTAAMARSWEVVVDMFAGVGQFSIPIAVHARPAVVYAVELNPDAHKYLVRNIKANGVTDVVKPLLGDCREVVAGLGQVADRVIMGYLHDTLGYLPHALESLSRAGGVIHLHSLSSRGKEETLASEASSIAEKLGYAAKPLGVRIVKSYSPSKVHAVIDLFAVKI